MFQIVLILKDDHVASISQGIWAGFIFAVSGALGIAVFCKASRAKYVQSSTDKSRLVGMTVKPKEGHKANHENNL